MSGQQTFITNFVFHLRYFSCSILTFIILGISVSVSFGADDPGFSDNGTNVIRSGGKRSKSQINQYIKTMQNEMKDGLAADPAERWLKQDKTGKYAVQKKFAYSVHTSKKALEKIQKNIEQGSDISSEIETLLGIRDAVKGADKAMQVKFSDVEQKCKDENFSAVIIERHIKMVEEHNENVQTLLDSFDELNQMANEEAWDEIPELIGLIKKQLDDYQVIKEPPLLQKSQPHGIMYIEAPRVDIEETVIPSMAPNASDEDGKTTLESTKAIEPTILKEDEDAITPMFVLGPPVAEDLEPTLDVQITQEIIDLAASLDNSPLKIYEYVRNNFEFEPYLGSRKGSQETLNQMAGNDYDLASLLIALLRASGISARYVQGTVEMPVDRAKNWLGVNDGPTAGNILTTVGMDGVNYYLDDEHVSIRCSRVWVEAYIPYTNYRGVGNDESGKMWVPMDPAMKQHDYQEGIDIPKEMGFDAESFISDYISTFHELSPVELYMQQINDYLAANYPEYSYEDIVRTRTIAQENFGFIPGSLPFIVRSVDSDFAEIPSDKRYKMRFRLYNGGTTFIDYTANLPEIAGKRVTISYIPATQADEDVIVSYGGMYDTPPYLINLRPVLKIDGHDVAVSSAGIGMGKTHSSDMHFTTPTGQNNTTPVVSNSIIAGTYQAIGIDTGRINPDIFMPESGGETPSIDDITGGKLWKTAMGYLDRVERNDEEVEKTMQVVITKDVSEAIVENTILVTYSGSTPQSFEWRGMVVDADRCTVGPFPVDGDNDKQKAFMVLSGADGSISENRIFEDTFDEEAVSTIKILELASDMGIPIYTFNSSNIGSIYSSLNLSSTVESAIYSAVAGGQEVTVPRDNITYLEWYGTGYIDMDPISGAAGYIISGGHSGGATVDIWISWKMLWGVLAGEIFHDIDHITADITFPPADGEYFPSLTWWDFLNSNKLHFDVTYTIHYDDGGNNTIYENYYPHYPYPAGEYTFYAEWDTGEERKFKVFGVEIETPDGENAIVECDPITLKTKFTPSAPSSPTYQWSKSWSLGCLFGSGEGTFTPDNAADTEFEGTTSGGIAAEIAVSNTYGTTKATKCLTVVGVEKIKAEDSDDSSNYVEDIDKATESDIQTIYVAKSDTGTVNISVEPAPSSITESELPTDWKIEKVSGSLAFDGAVGKLSAKVKKDTSGDIIVKITPCSSSSAHFQVKIIVLEIVFDPAKVNKKNMSTNEYGEYEKCAAKVWETSEELDLFEYLAGDWSGSLAELKDKVEWGIDDAWQDSGALDYGGEPSDQRIISFEVDVRFKNYTNVSDRLILVIIPRSTSTGFNNWYAAQSADRGWLEELPSLYSRVNNNADPEPDTCDPQRWDTPDFSVNTHYHPGASIEMRSEETEGGHGHQACYNAARNLINSGVSAGTADRSHPSNLIGSDSHANLDVIPFIWSLQLDGNPVMGTTLNLNLTGPIFYSGSNVDNYLDVRPPIANSKSQIEPDECSE